MNARQAGSPAMPAAPMTRRGELVTIALGSWLIVGLFLDGWAHNNLPRLETFFTPWHAVFYSGFLAITAWIGWLISSRRVAGRPLAHTLPAGYRSAAVGVLLFSISGLGDMAWHLAFGIERDVAALLSPTHLGLFAGAFLIITAPLRSLWADRTIGRGASLRRLLPAVMSVALAGALCAFILMELDVFHVNFYTVAVQQFIAGSYPGDSFVPNRNIEAGVGGFILTTVFLFGPLLFLLRRWDLPGGAILAVIGTQSVAIAALKGFRDPGLILLGLIGAGAVEASARALRPSPSRLNRLRAFCAVAPAAFWAIYLGGVALGDGGLGWSAEVWGGAVVWSSLTMLGLSLVMYPPALPDPQEPVDLVDHTGDGVLVVADPRLSDLGGERERRHATRSG